MSIITPEKVIAIIEEQTLPDREYIENIFTISKRYKKDTTWVCLGAFHYGVMVGIQQERKRRRKAAERAAENGVTKCYHIKK